MNFTPYTIAKNCTDLTDLEAGIDELNEYLANCRRINKQPLKTAYLRLGKLVIKKEKLSK